jgi:hypothetical protein
MTEFIEGIVDLEVPTTSSQYHEQRVFNHDPVSVTRRIITDLGLKMLIQRSPLFPPWRVCHVSQ